MAKCKTTPWNKIKAEYLQGVTPKELAEKYGLTSKQVSNKANSEKWTIESKQIKEKISKNSQDKIQELTDLALDRLEEILTDDEVSTRDLLIAIGKVIELSGLKNAKPENKRELPTIIIDGVDI